jgi:hypothetical protein
MRAMGAEDIVTGEARQWDVAQWHCDETGMEDGYILCYSMCMLRAYTSTPNHICIHVHSLMTPFRYPRCICVSDMYSLRHQDQISLLPSHWNTASLHAAQHQDPVQ